MFSMAVKLCFFTLRFHEKKDVECESKEDEDRYGGSYEYFVYKLNKL